MNIMGYVRVSTVRQGKDGVSLEAQESALRAWASAHQPGAPVKIYADRGLSGKRADNRPALGALLAECVAGDIVVVYCLSRLSRSVRDTLRMCDDLRAGSVGLVSLSENLDTTTAAGRLVLNVLAVLAQYQREQTAEVTAEALQCKRGRGGKTGGEIPYGWCLIGDAKTGRLVPEDAEQAAIQRIQEMRASGFTLRAIAVTLTSSGVLPRKGGRWHAQVIADILRRAA